MPKGWGSLPSDICAPRRSYFGGVLVLLYFAGPMFSSSEVAFNARLAAQIETLGYDVFLPQRDGYEVDWDYVANGFEAPAQAIFDLDKDQILACDVLLCVLDGRVPDEGMAVEIGLAYADRIHSGSDRLLIGFSTDPRHRRSAGLNAMVVGALDEIHHDEIALLGRLQAVLARRSLEDGTALARGS